ncbi:MAG: DNA sulfur modification protein DndB [Vicinamibacterales bacterium]
MTSNFERGETAQEMADAAHAFTYQFSALRGRQAGREYFAAMVPLVLVPKLFVFDDEELKPEFRAQRKLNRARVPEIARYVLDHPGEYVFSALTASIDGAVEFMPATKNGATKNVGVLSVAMSSRFIINDGQHRRAAIEQVLRERPEFASETICVVLFIDAGLERSQQMFADLNKHAVRPTRSLGVLYDHRDPLSKLARQLAGEVPIFRDLTEMDKATISNRSIKLFTLSSIYFATRQLLEKPARASVTAKESRLAARFWTEVGKNMADWQLAARRAVSSAELRREYIHAHGVALQALAIAGCELIKRFPGVWAGRLKGLQEIDWSRNNSKLWEGRAMIGGRVSKATNNVELTANVIKDHLGLGLSEKQEKLERIHGDATGRRSFKRGSSARTADTERRTSAGT